VVKKNRHSSPISTHKCVKFIYSERATKYDETSKPTKSWRFRQVLVAIFNLVQSKMKKNPHCAQMSDKKKLLRTEANPK
jgi:hypothetical protein